MSATHLLKKSLLALLFVFSHFAYSQLSTKHYISPIHSRQNNSIEDHFLYLSTPTPTPFEVTVTDGSGAPIPGSPFTISAGNSQTIRIGNGQPSVMFVEKNDLNIVQSNKGLIATSTGGQFYANFRVRHRQHAGSLTAKGIIGAGTSFRLGSIPLPNVNAAGRLRNFFASVMATEDNTTITFSDYDPNIMLSGMGPAVNPGPTINVTLNAGETYIVSGYDDVAANLSGFVGALVTSDKPITAVTGNAMGSFSDTAHDIAIDQIVPLPIVGTEYVVVEGVRNPILERPIVIATANNTEIRVNGVLETTINSGDFYVVDNDRYQGANPDHRNMRIESTQPIYVYQIVAGRTGDGATAGMNFLPPFDCLLLTSVNSVPDVDAIGAENFPEGGLFVITRKTPTLEVRANGILQTNSQEVPAGFAAGSEELISYRVTGFTGDVVIESTEAVAVSLYGSNGSNSGYAGYYSGFGNETENAEVEICENGIPIDILGEIPGSPVRGGTWTPPFNGGGDIFDPSVDTSGTYIYNFSNRCSTVEIEVLIEVIPNADAGADVSIPCGSPSVILNQMASPTSGFTYRWTTSGTGSFATGTPTNQITVTVDAAGTYTLTTTFTTSDGTVCTSSDDVEVTASGSAPALGSADLNLINCSNSMVPTFDLTSKEALILNGADSSVFSVSYFVTMLDASSNSNPIPSSEVTSFSNTTNPQTIFANISNVSGTCSSTVSFELQVVEPEAIVVNTPNTTELTCTAPEIELNASGSTTNLGVISYSWSTSGGGVINGDDTLAQITVDTPGTYEVEVISTFEGVTCSDTETIVITSNSSVSAGNPNDLTICDDVDSSIDGFAEFDFSGNEALILSLVATPADFEVTYFRSLSDANSDINSITNPTTYINSTVGSEIIYARLSDVRDVCVDITSFSLNVNAPIAIITPPTSTDLDCSNPTITLDASASTNSNSSSSSLGYLWTASGGGVISGDPTLATLEVSDAGVYQVEVSSTINGAPCLNTTSITINSSTALSAGKPDDITSCEDTSITTSGSAIFDLQENESQIFSRGSGITPSNFMVTYFENAADADLNPTNFITNPNTYEGTDNTVIYARVFNTSGNCVDVTNFTLNVNSLEAIITPPSTTSLDCVNETIRLDGSTSTSSGTMISYLWSTDATSGFDSSVDITSPVIDISEAGTYTLEIASELNGVLCSTTTPITINSNVAPPSIGSPPNLVSCDSDSNGLAVFDLTDNDDAVRINNTTNPISVYNIDYFESLSDANSDTNVISDPRNYRSTSNGQEIFVRIANSSLACQQITSFFLIGFPEVSVSAVTETLNCDTLSITIRGNAASAPGVVSTYSWTSSNRVSIDPSTNTTGATLSVDEPDTYTLTVSSTFMGENCISSDSIVIDSDVSSPTIGVPNNLILCDTDNNGTELFDLEMNTSEIISSIPLAERASYNVTYYTSQSNADMGISPITNTSGFQNTISPQIIYGRLAKNACFSTASFEIIVPVLNVDAGEPRALSCDTDTIMLDGSDSSGASPLEYLWTTTDGNIVSGATTETPIIDAEGTYFLEIAVTVSGNRCTKRSSVLISPEETPIADAGTDTPLLCSTATRLNGSNSRNVNGTTEDLSYMWTGPGNIINENTENPSVDAEGTYTLEVTYTNSAGETCVDIDSVTVTPPEPIFVDEPTDIIECDLSLTGVFDFDLTPNNAILLGSKSPSVFSVTYFTSMSDAIADTNRILNPSSFRNTSNPQTIYSRVSNIQGSCTNISNFEIGLTNPIDTNISIDVNTTRFATNNTITVEVSGTGSYLYSLVFVPEGTGDDVISVPGDFQTSNVFENLTPGVYDVFVSDVNGCGEIMSRVLVFGIPNVFTPNGDGVQDFWKIQGPESLISGSEIYVFNRFGKLLKHVTTIEEGWDGTYVGKPLPSNEYWYSITLSNGELFTGHFTLKR